MDTFNLHVENYFFAKFRNIWPKAIFHKDSAGSFIDTLRLSRYKSSRLLIK